ncbi:MAG: hypothetical protein FJ301_08240 [Planctomycetes bacterium]|nr:hypothetical protein [Planctomycetota bacterium]
MNNVLSDLQRALASVLAGGARFPDEDRFQAALAEALGSVERELAASFDAPRLPPKRPPSSAIEALARAQPPKALPPEGKDPCARGAKLDLLWRRGDEAIPLELKYVTERKSDVYGYAVLKDMHRLERMRAAGSHPRLSAQRFCVFVTTEPVYWTGGRPEPAPFWLQEGRRIGPAYWVQYDQPSPNTLWYSYPPFFLANAYEFRWLDHGRAGRSLVVAVPPQPTG